MSENPHPDHETPVTGHDHAHQSLTQRALRWAPGVGALGVLLGLALVMGLVLFDRSLDRVQVDGLADEGETERAEGPETTVTIDDDGQDAAPPDRLGTTLHVLVIGSDDRSVLTPEERRELSTGDAEGERTEALALVRIDPETDRVDVLRFPRDLLVTRCDGTRGRINAAFGIGQRNGQGGSSCLVQTITTWTGIPIHHVVKVDFRGFVDAVDAVGGVDVWLDEPLEDRHAGLDVPAGCVHLDGADALAFVRARHVDDDFGRIGRQQQLVAATMDQILTPSTLTDPRRLGRLLTTAQRSLEMDDRLTAQRLRAIASTVAGLDGEQLVTRTVDGEVRLSDHGIAFLHPDEEHAEVLFEAFAAGELPSTPDRGGGGGTAARPRDDASPGAQSAEDGEPGDDERAADAGTGSDADDGMALDEDVGAGRFTGGC